VPYVVAWMLVQTSRIGQQYNSTTTLPGDNFLLTNIQFRALLGFGAIPCFILLWKEITSTEGAATHNSQSHFKEALKEPKYWRQLLGTGGTWFLFDISYYGTAIFQPVIIHAIFTEEKDVITDAFFWHNLLVSALGIPGVLAAIMVLKPFGGRWLSIYGFWLNAIGFAGLAICFELEPGTGASATNTTTAPSSVYLASYGPIGGMDVPGLDVGLGAGAGKGGGPDLKWVKFAAFCLLNFALNWGPNISTYVLPATVYPQKVRSTFHGLSASCGKVGAVVGTFMFPVIHTYYGIAAVLWVQVACSLVGVGISVLYLDKPDAKQGMGISVNSDYL